MKTFEEIYQAVNNGSLVHWMSEIYVVVKDSAQLSGYGLLCTTNDYYVGLYEPDYKPSDFYLG